MDNKSPRNKTLHPRPEDLSFFESSTLYQEGQGLLFLGDCKNIPLVPHSIDLLIADPPYNMDKSFHDFSFKKLGEEAYARYTEEWLGALKPFLRETASVYVCCDWRNSSIVQGVLARHFTILNRITWEREKGRGALRNWKNSSEDIWFAVCGKGYTFNPGAVKLKKRVIAPYRRSDGTAKDWAEDGEGKFRLTYPSNLWTDITIPYWSMAENTPHPTQKPEKLLAKLILASSSEGDWVLDPFCGSGSTLAAAKKLGRRFAGAEIDPYYAALGRRRLILAEGDGRIQGYEGGVFRERNSP